MRLTAIPAAALLISTAVWAADTGYNFDQQSDFSKYKTYKWVDIKGGKDKVSEITDRNILAAIDAEMAKKGLAKVTNDPADLYIGYQAGITANQEYTTYNMGGGPGWGYGGGWGWGGGGIAQTTSSTIHTGHLVLDMYDVSNKRMVWRGMVSDTVEATNKPEKNLKKLNKAVEKMMKNYPPKKKS